MTYPIADLHSDLLSFLVDHPSKTIYTSESRASYPQMKQGHVALQALTIFTYSKPGSHEYGKKQIGALFNLLEDHKDKYSLWDPSVSLKNPQAEKIQVVPVFENGYALCEETQKIEEGIAFLEKIRLKLKNILYISLTWDLENRFGGGCGSRIGLKEDGKKILEWLHQKKIAIDLSHASDFLADDIFNFLDKKSLEIPVMASHSNMRFVTPKERNLPDSLIKEILYRKGIIGLNFFAPFIGASSDLLINHVEHLFSLGGKNHLCFGGDFFHFESFSYIQEKYKTSTAFFPEFENASCYQKALSFLQKGLSLKDEEIQGIAFKNFESYIERTYLK